MMPELKDGTNISNCMTECFDLFVRMQKSQLTVTNRLDALEAPEFQRGFDTRSALYSTLVTFKSDTKLVDAKACRVT